MLSLFLFFWLIFTSFLNTCYADSTEPASVVSSKSESSSATTPKEYVVPRRTTTDARLRIRDSKSCGEYLSICERSCKDRGTLFKFQCIGQDFQPYNDHSRCTCADDLFARGESIDLKTDQIMMMNMETAK